jgi:site-specific DNA recombinase
LGGKRRWLPGIDETDKYEFAIALRQKVPQPLLRLVGGPKPTLRERAVALARDRGDVRTFELTAIGVPRCYLSLMCEEGLLVKVGYGRYRAAVLNAV